MCWLGGLQLTVLHIVSGNKNSMTSLENYLIVTIKLANYLTTRYKPRRAK